MSIRNTSVGLKSLAERGGDQHPPREALRDGAQGEQRYRVALLAIRRTLAGAQTKAFLGAPSAPR
jgi:hypothetical protein